MNCLRTLCLSSLFVPALSASFAPADSISFHPADGTKVSRSWSIKQELTLDEMNMTVNGQPLPMDIQMDMDMTNEMSVEVSDVFVSVKDGRPIEMRRTFDKLASDGHFAVEMPMMPDGGMEQSITGKSELEGKTVKFAWDAEASQYERTYHESEGEAELLEGLDEDMDVRGIAPGKDVATGDTWKVDVKALRALLAPGGDLAIRPEKTGAEMQGMMPGMSGMGDLADMIGDALEGEASAEYLGLQELEGGKFAVIKLKFDISCNTDMADKMDEMMRELPEGMGSMKFEHIDLEFGIEAEGTLHWDPALGMIHAADLSGKMKINMDMAMKMNAQGQDMAFEQSMAMSGTIAIKQDVTKN
ncbi:MAG: hypothetical protein IT454_18965 [Planctomycetes bacterium]|nr:hypothetical protein [Planctomycetota bacterium]